MGNKNALNHAKVYSNARKIWSAPLISKVLRNRTSDYMHRVAPIHEVAHASLPASN